MKKALKQMLPPGFFDGYNGLGGTSEEAQRAQFLRKIAAKSREELGKIFIKDLEKLNLNKIQKKAFEWTKSLKHKFLVPQVYKAAVIVLEAGFDYLDKCPIYPKCYRSKDGIASICYNSEGYNLVETQTPFYIQFNTTTKFIESDSHYDSPKGRLVLNRWQTQPNSALHELGHLISYSQRPVKNWRELDKRFSSVLKEKIKNGVSKYAAEDRAEFEAEIIAGMLAGRKYAQEFIDLLPTGNEAFEALKEKGTEE